MLAAVALLTLCWSAALRVPLAGTVASPAAAARASPAAAARAPPPRAASVQVGSLVLFTSKQGEPVLGAVIEEEGKKKAAWKVLAASGRTASVAPRSIKHVVPGARASKESHVAKHEAAAAAALAGGGEELEAVWEMLLEEKQPSFALEAISELLLGDASSESCYASYALLASGVGKACFKPVGGDGSAFAARPAAEAERLRAQARAEGAAAEERLALKARVDAAAAAGASFALADESAAVREAFGALERLGCRAALEAADDEAEPGDEGARALLKQLGRKATAESARLLLVSLRVWSKHEDLELRRLRVPVGFGADLTAEAAAIAAEPPVDADAATRRDLTHLAAFAIDEVSTIEVDDAISIEVVAEDGPVHAQQRLWVHIADPSRYVALGTRLDLEARRRGSSAYLPAGTIPMFPLGLAAEVLSLVPGTASCALSVGIQLDAEGAIDGAVPLIIAPSTVRVTRLTYADVDGAIGDPFAEAAVPNAPASGAAGGGAASAAAPLDDAALEVLRRLEWLSRQRLEWRVRGGSMEAVAPSGLPDMSIKAREVDGADDGWDVDVTTGGARVDGPARRIVTECMLLAGEAAARYGEAHGVPMPFRAQAMRQLDEIEVQSTPEGPCRAWMAIRQMGPSKISESPQPHEGLALEAYTQLTSPIRRYADLAVQHQLKAHLRGEPPPFGADELLRLAREGGLLARKLQRSAEAYWLREYLRRRAGAPMAALVLGADRRKPELYKLLLLEQGALVDATSSRSLEVGSQLLVAPNKAGEVAVESY